MNRTDLGLVKIVDGTYRYGPFQIIRNGRRWILQRGNGVSETYGALRLAMVAARVVAHVASGADLNAFVPPVGE